MPQFSNKRRVRHSADKMFDLVADVERYPEFVPMCQALKVRQRTPGPDGTEVTWLDPPGPSESALASVVEGIDWPEGEGYFWMAGESSQMRAIRKHLMREVRLPSTSYDVMGYWRGGSQRHPRAVDPGPIWRAGKAAGKSDEEIWAAYDAEVSR